MGRRPVACLYGLRQLAGVPCHRVGPGEHSDPPLPRASLLNRSGSLGPSRGLGFPFHPWICRPPYSPRVKERCESGRIGLTANELTWVTGSEGSNPSLSAHFGPARRAVTRHLQRMSCGADDGSARGLP